MELAHAGYETPETAPNGSFATRLDNAVTRADSLVCVGLDPDPAQLPAHLRTDPEGVLRFNLAIVEATHDLVCAYKLNLGFYVGLGLPGLAALIETRRRIPRHIPVILDAKVGDINSTAAAYARGYFGVWDFDAITVNPYLGADSLAPFLADATRGILVVCKTSNPGSGDLQDVVVCNDDGDRAPVYQTVARRAAAWAATAAATVGLVVGATYPAQLAEVRAACPTLPILLPGVGAQAGDLEAALRAGLDPRGRGLIVSSSRAITYAGAGPDFAHRAREAVARLRETVNAVRRADASTRG